MPQKATQNTSIQNTLKELGLGENEALLYEVLLKTPDATIPQLRLQTSLSRTMLYYVLANLINSELADHKKVGKKTVYNAAPPEKLEDFVAEQEKDILRQKAMLGDVLGDLKSAYRLAHNKPTIKFYEGMSGIKEVWWDSLNSKTEIYTYGDLELIAKNFGKLNEEYLKERIKRNISKKAITNSSTFNRTFLEKYDTKLTETRLITGATPIDFSATVLQIYDGKISYSTLVGDSIIGVIISDPQIYSMQKNLFEYIWSTAETKKSAPIADNSRLPLGGTL